MHRRETSSTHFKHMTNNTNTNTNAAKTSFVKQATTALAFAAAPFAIVLGIAGMAAIDAPSAEARTCTTFPSGYKSCM